MVRYKALFRNKHISVNTEVLNYCLDPISKYNLVLRINEVNIDIDGFEVLHIEDAKQYGKQQLKIFEYEIIQPYEDRQKKDLLLANFYLEVIIPIPGLDKNSNTTQTKNLHVHVHCNEEKLYKYHFKLLNATSELSDITDALQEIQNQLRDTFILEICACCKNSSRNPYGGVPFFNHLCFRNDKKLFWVLKDKSKYTVAPFMNDAKWESTYVTYRCEEFLPF